MLNVKLEKHDKAAILHRAMKEKEAEVAIRNVRQDVMGVFRVTGIAMFFNFE